MESYTEKTKRLNETYDYQNIEVAGAVFQYLTAGESNNKAIVLLNGGMNSHEMWVDFIDLLAPKYRLISFDYPKALKTIQATANGIAEFLNAIGIRECYLVGASFGGFVAQTIAKKNPQLVKGMFLFDTGSLDADTIKDFRRKYFFAPLALFYMRHCNYDKRMKPLIAKSLDKHAVNESAEMREYVHEMAVSIAQNYTREKDLHITTMLADIMEQEPVTAENFSSIQPVILILPSDDFFTPKQQENLKAVFPQARAVQINGGHMSTITRATEFAAIIDDTISGIKPS